MVEINKEISHLEWEYDIRNIDFKYPSIKSIEFIYDDGKKVDINKLLTINNVKIYRDDNYRLTLDISGIGDLLSQLNNHVNHISSIIINNSGNKYEFDSCYFKNYNLDDIIYGKDRCVFTISYLVNKISHVIQKSKSPKWLTEWYINFTNKFIYSDVTEYIRDITHTWKLANNIEIKYNPHTLIDEFFFDNLSRDCEYIPKFEQSPAYIIKSVPPCYGEKDTGNVGIIFHSDFGEIPSDNTRKSLSEILGFVVGKQLVNFGYTSYDEFGKIIEYILYSPSDSARINGLGKSSIHLPPINTDLTHNGKKLHEFLPKLTNSYLGLHEKYHLSDIIYRYWLGINLPLGMNIMILQNCLEILTKCALGFNPDLNLLKNEKTTGCRGLKKCFIKLCSQLNIHLSPTELKSLELRNDIIHSLRSLENLRHDELIEEYTKCFTYILLFHRILLVCLGYNGKYIDYTTRVLKNISYQFIERSVYECSNCPYDKDGLSFEKIHNPN